MYIHLPQAPAPGVRISTQLPPGVYAEEEFGMDFTWTGGLNPYQERVWDAFWKYDQVAAVAGWGTGKTMALSFCFLVFMLSAPPKAEMIAIGPTVPAVVRTVTQGISEVLPMLQPSLYVDMARELGDPSILETFGYTQGDWLSHPLIEDVFVGGQAPRLVLHGGRTIHFKGAHKRQPSWDGMSNQWGAWLNEVRLWHYQHPEEVAGGRVRLSATEWQPKAKARGLRTKIAADTIPAAGHWCQALFDADKQGEREDDSGATYHEVRGNLFENTLVDRAYVARQSSKYRRGTASYRRFIMGEWAASTGAIFADVVTQDAWDNDWTMADTAGLNVGGIDFGAIPGVWLASHRGGTGRKTEKDEREITVWYQVDNSGVPTTKAVAQRFANDLKNMNFKGRAIMFYDPAGDQKVADASSTNAQQFQVEVDRILGKGRVLLKRSPTHRKIRDVQLSTDFLIRCFLEPGTGRRRIKLTPGIMKATRPAQDEGEKPPKTLADALLGIEWDKNGKPKKDGVHDHWVDSLRYGAAGWLWSGEKTDDAALAAIKELNEKAKHARKDRERRGSRVGRGLLRAGRRR